MTVKISPILNDAQLDNNGLPLSGGKIYWYVAGTTTPASVYQDSGGTIPHTSPVVLNVRGEPPAPIWLTTGQAYKAVLQDSLGNQLRVIDNVSGVNDVSTPTVSEWLLQPVASYASASTFSVVGDLRSTFTYYRRIKAVVTAGICYGTISAAPTFAAGVTTVSISVDNALIPLDAGLSSLYYGFLDPAYPSFNVTPSIPSGAVMPFYMANPPAGFTAAAIQNDSMMRVVTAGATGGASGAGAGHSPIINSVVASHTHGFTSGTESAPHTHNDAGHTHAITYYQSTGGGSAAANSQAINSIGGATAVGYASLGNETGSHTHSGTTDGGSSGTNWQPRYMDFCIGVKS